MLIEKGYYVKNRLLLSIAMLIVSLCSTAAFAVAPTVVDTDEQTLVLQAGHQSLEKWKMPDKPPFPAGNELTPARVELGKQLFFDPRLSRDGNMSCATCHNPLFGWSDGLATAKGFKSQTLARATPTIVNTAYNSIQMWDGRKKDLEDQAMGPMESNAEMNMDLNALFKSLAENAVYKAAFEKAYPGESISAPTVSKALATFERTIISNTSRFDAWLGGDTGALTEREINGFRVFVDSNKGNCSVCHSAPNFTDNGFHNLGLASWGIPAPDVGRFAQKPVAVMKGAFKTPTLRDISLTAPYFHDGSAKTLEEVVDHYVKGGKVKTNLSPNMKALNLSSQEKADLVAFLKTLTSPQRPVTLPALPL